MGSNSGNYAKNNQAYLQAVSKEYILAGDKFRKTNAKNVPVSGDGNWVVGPNKQFSMKVSGQQIEALGKVNLKQLFSQEYLTTETQFH